jgi:general secretion pathway protein D
MKSHRPTTRLCLLVSVIGSLNLTACALRPSSETPFPAPLTFKQNGPDFNNTPQALPTAVPNAPTAAAQATASGPRIVPGPKLPPRVAGNLRPSAAPTPNSDAGTLTVNFEQVTLPAFIQAVYGGILKLNHSVDTAVNARTELITFRTPQPLSPEKLRELSIKLLKSYGIAVQDLGGTIRIVPDNNLASTLPLIRRGRAHPTVPTSLRPVFHYVETESVRPQTFLVALRAMLKDKVTIEPDPNGVGLLLSGQPDNVQVALELIQVFDQPSLRGTNNARIIPRYWGADEFARRLAEILRSEGYNVGTTAGADPITILPIPPVNSVMVFTANADIMQHILTWSRELDQINNIQAGSAFFTYAARHADAQELAKSLNELISGPSATPSAPAPGTTTTTAAASTRQKRIVVNNATNSLIFQGGSQEDYRQWLTLLTELDKPVKSALIDVLVAEVALTNSNNLGFTWQLDKLGSGATAVKLSGTTYKAGISGSGLNVNALLGGDLLRQLAISALASNSDSRVISNPKVMTRNGESASINVGQEVPTVTSQGSSSSTGTFTTTTNVIPQTIQYRNTGVLLRVRPVIHAGDRIDLDISQEVSSAEPTTTGVTSSPTIRKRSIDTKLSLRDGATVMLGGLISETNTDSDSGVPLIKDIPGLGNLFKNANKSRNRTELVVMITPYIINDFSEAEAATGNYLDNLSDWAKGLRDRHKITPPKARPVPAPSEPSEAVPPQSSSVMEPPAWTEKPKASNTDGERMVNMAPNSSLSNSSTPSTTPSATTPGSSTSAPPAQNAHVPPTHSAPVNMPNLPPGIKLNGARPVTDPELMREILKSMGR